MKSMSASLQEPQHSVLGEDALIRYYDEPTRLKINKHLNDINDIITDEDIRNINTDLTLQMLHKVPAE